MPRQALFLILIGLIVACGGQVKDDRTSLATDTVSTATVSSRQLDSGQALGDLAKPLNPHTIVWIPGQKDTEDFNVLSKFRAHARLSEEFLVLTLGTLPTGTVKKPGTSDYRVADSVVTNGLLRGELFNTDCKRGSSARDGQIVGISSGAAWDRWERPRLAWQFDTVKMRIQPIATDSVACLLLRPED